MDVNKKHIEYRLIFLIGCIISDVLFPCAEGTLHFSCVQSCFIEKSTCANVCKISGKMKLATTFFRGGF